MKYNTSYKLSKILELKLKKKNGEIKFTKLQFNCFLKLK